MILNIFDLVGITGNGDPALEWNQAVELSSGYVVGTLCPRHRALVEGWKKEGKAFHTDGGFTEDGLTRSAEQMLLCAAEAQKGLVATRDLTQPQLFALHTFLCSVNGFQGSLEAFVAECDAEMAEAVEMCRPAMEETERRRRARSG